MKYLFFTIVFLTLNFLPRLAFSQKRDIKFVHYNTSNGLSQNTVHAIAQDNKGFLWVGTEDGLNRFDGYSFNYFKKDNKDPFSVSDNFANSLFVDSKHNLWVGTNDKGINVYNGAQEQFTSCQTYTENGKTFPIRFVSSIVEDKRGNIWFSAYGGLFKYNPDSAKVVAHFSHSDFHNSLSDNYIRSLYIEDDLLWIGTETGGLNRFDLQSQNVTIYRPTKDITSISNNGVSSILRDKAGRLWIGTNNGLNLMNERDGSFQHFFNDPKDSRSLGDNIIYCLYEDKSENLWIGTPTGLNLFDRRNSIFFNWTHDPLNPKSLSENIIFSIFEDRYGQIWLGSPTTGLNKFNPSYKEFSHYFHNPLNPNSLSDNLIREIYQDNSGLIWIGTFDSGLDVYNPSTKQFAFYNNNPKKANSLSSNKVTSVLKDSKETVWIGTLGGGLNKAIPKNGAYIFEHFEHNSDDSLSISSNMILDIVEDCWGRIWLGTRAGLDLFDTQTGKVIRYKNKPNDRNCLLPNSIQSGCILFDNANNTMWVGTWAGLTKISLSPVSHLPTSYVQYQQNDTAIHSLSDSRVISMLLDKNNILWVGTCGGGLNKLTLKSNGDVDLIEYFNENNGLSNNVIYGILDDAMGSLWLSTNLGLSKFTPSTKSFDNYDVNDGLQSNQFYWGAACKLQSGEFAFGGVNGFNTFSSDRISPDSIAPDMVITDFRIFNVKVPVLPNSRLTESIIYANRVELSYLDKAISFEFAALHLFDPSKNKYAYMLQGFDKDWIYTDATKRFTVYTNLDAGEYVFKVKGSNADGVWSNSSADLKIVILPPFWSSWWFRTLVFSIAVITLLSFYWWRTASLRRRHKFLEKVVDEKTREVLLQKEELQSANEELVVSNEELFEQREELEATLISLTEAQNKMIQLEKMASIGVLAAGVAHEINNPLNFINGGIIGLETYFNEKLPDHLDEVAPMINGIQMGVSRAAAIVSSLGHYSRHDDEKFFECDVHSIIDNCLVILQSEIKDHVEVVKEYANQSCRLVCNEGKLHQALLNILSNAVQSINGFGVVTIRTLFENDALVIVISDTGCGISEKNISKIMDPFFTTKDPGKGTGLGLSITYNIIKEHKGTIEFSSIIGEGTKVIINLPSLKSEINE